MNHDEEIRNARAALAQSGTSGRDMDALMRRANALAASPAFIRTPADRRDPLDEASYAVQQSVADFYVLLRKAERHTDVMKIWDRLGELEELISACASAAGRKADAL